MRLKEEQKKRETEEIDIKFNEKIDSLDKNKKIVDGTDENQITLPTSILTEPYKNPEMNYFQATKTLNLWILFISLGFFFLIFLFFYFLF